MRSLVVTFLYSVKYAAESVLVNFSNQLDAIMLGTLLPLTQFGTYQAGSRFTQSVAPLASVLAVDALPALAV